MIVLKEFREFQEYIDEMLNKTWKKICEKTKSLTKNRNDFQKLNRNPINEEYRTSQEAPSSLVKGLKYWV
jgi:hypothetical protein